MFGHTMNSYYCFLYCDTEKLIINVFSYHIHNIVHGELSEASRWTRIKTRKFCSSLFSNSCHNRRNKCLNILYSMQIFKYYTIAWKSLFIMHRKHYSYYNQLIGVMIMSPNSLALLYGGGMVQGIRDKGCWGTRGIKVQG